MHGALSVREFFSPGGDSAVTIFDSDGPCLKILARRRFLARDWTKRRRRIEENDGRSGSRRLIVEPKSLSCAKSFKTFPSSRPPPLLFLSHPYPLSSPRAASRTATFCAASPLSPSSNPRQAREMGFSRFVRAIQVEQDEGSTFLANKDLLPVPPEHRLWKAWNFWTFWSVARVSPKSPL